MSEQMLSVGLQKPTDRLRLSKQALEFLIFLNNNNVDGSSYFKESKKDTVLSIDAIIAERNQLEKQFYEQMRMNGSWYNKSLSVANYIRVTGKSEVRTYEYG